MFAANKARQNTVSHENTHFKDGDIFTEAKTTYLDTSILTTV